jgi:hypothetical protein
MTMQLYVSNTNLIYLYRLWSEVQGEYINDATVTVTIVDQDGNPVAGPSGVWPVTMEAAGDSSPPQGDYYGVLSDQLQFVAGTTYTAKVDVDAGPGRVGHWEIQFLARTRVS